MTEKEIREKAEEVVKRHYNISVHQVDSIASERLSNDIFAALAAAHRQGREEGLVKMRMALDRLEEQAERGGFTQSWRDALTMASDELNSLLSQPDGSGGEKGTV